LVNYYYGNWSAKFPKKLKNAERRLKPQAAQLEGVTRKISESLFTTNGHSPKAALPAFFASPGETCAQEGSYFL